MAVARALVRSAGALALAAVAALPGAAPGEVATAAPAPLAVPALSPGNLTIDGAGYGHGIGLSQWGAYGYAVDFGWTSAQILDHYYSGTTAGAIPVDQELTVRMLGLDGQQTAVISENGTALLQGGTGTPYDALVARRVGSTYTVWGRTDVPACPPPTMDLANPLNGWTQVAAGIPSATFTLVTPPAPTTPLSGLVGVCEPDGGVRYHRGRVTAVADAAGALRTVVALPMEQYLRSVIAIEMSASWGAAGGGRGAQALQAQAVAARSYGMAESRYAYAKTCDSQSCQVYRGAARRPGLGLAATSYEFAATDAAVAATAGVVRRTSGGAVAYTMFSASSGGYTAPSLNGYVAVPDDGDATAPNPNHRWTVSIEIARVEQAWPAVGTLTGITVTQRNGLGEWGGRVQQLKLVGTAGTVTTTGNDFRSKLGLKSDWFSVRPFGCLGNDAPPVTGAAPTAGAATFTAVTPARLVDTRSGQGAPKAPLIGGCTIAVDPNLPDGATAAVVNITTVDTVTGGFITPYPCGSPKPWVSTVQTVPGRIVPGTTVVPLGPDGRFCLYSPTTTNVVVDLFGYYGPTGTGRYTPLAVPARRFNAPVARGANVPVPVTGAGVPGSGVESVAVTVHATGAVEAGYVTISACESPRPYTSVLNVMPGQTVANHTHVRVSDLGQVCVFASSPMTVMLDVSGWFGAAGATTFHAVPPARAMDTRSSFGNGGRLVSGDNRPLPLWGRAGVPATGAVAVAATTTIVAAPTVGYLTVHACVSPIPNVSMVRNLPPWNSATMVLGATDAQGRWCLRAGSTAMDVLVDVVGWYGP